MGEDEDRGIKYYWEKYLPCRLHRKNIVLILLTIFCFGLVTWTVVATIEDPNATTGGSNVTTIVIDDSKELAGFNFTTQSARLQAVTQKKIKDALSKGFKGPKRIVLKDIPDASATAAAGGALCQCICNSNVTEADMLQGMMKLAKEAEAARLVSTTARPRSFGAYGDLGAYGGGGGGGRSGGDEEDYEDGEDGGGYDDTDDGEGDFDDLG